MGALLTVEVLLNLLAELGLDVVDAGVHDHQGDLGRRGPAGRVRGDHVEADLLALDREKLELERWITQEKAKGKAKEKAEKDRREQQLAALDSLKEDGLLSEEEYEVGVERVSKLGEEEE